MVPRPVVNRHDHTGRARKTKELPQCLSVEHLTDKTAFGPAAIEAMSKAFEEACIALQVYAGDEKGREIIATRIIDLARSGLIDPTALRDRVIAEARLTE